MSKRMPYTIVRRQVWYPSYNAYCDLCEGRSEFWDFRRNAVRAARSHMMTEHPQVTGVPKVADADIVNPGPWIGAHR